MKHLFSLTSQWQLVSYGSKPDEKCLLNFRCQQQGCSLSYTPPGITVTESSKGYQIDHNRIVIGKGQTTFVQACTALRNWQMFDLGWVQIYPTHPPIAEGTTVAVVGNVLGLWFLNACRIVYTVDARSGDLWRLGFAYGTLPGHIAKGEERFLIEWDRRDDTVYYDILAYSRPSTLLAKAGYPVMRYFQKRFARESKQAMVKAVIKE